MNKTKGTVENSTPERYHKYPNGYYSRVKSLENDVKLLRIELEAIKQHLGVNQGSTTNGIIKWFKSLKK